MTNCPDIGIVTGTGAWQMKECALRRLRHGEVIPHSFRMSPGEDMGGRIATPPPQGMQVDHTNFPKNETNGQPILINEKIPNTVPDKWDWVEVSKSDAWSKAAPHTAATSTYDMPSVDDVDPRHIGLLRSRLVRLQTTAGTLDSAIMMMFGQREWNPCAGVMLRSIVEHGLPDLEACFATVSHGSSVQYMFGLLIKWWVDDCISYLCWSQAWTADMNAMIQSITDQCDRSSGRWVDLSHRRGTLSANDHLGHHARALCTMWPLGGTLSSDEESLDSTMQKRPDSSPDDPAEKEEEKKDENDPNEKKEGGHRARQSGEGQWRQWRDRSLCSPLVCVEGHRAPGEGGQCCGSA